MALLSKNKQGENFKFSRKNFAPQIWSKHAHSLSHLDDKTLESALKSSFQNVSNTIDWVHAQIKLTILILQSFSFSWSYVVHCHVRPKILLFKLLKCFCEPHSKHLNKKTSEVFRDSFVSGFEGCPWKHSFLKLKTLYPSKTWSSNYESRLRENSWNDDTSICAYKSLRKIEILLSTVG